MTVPAARLLPVLYSFRRCPYAIRARMALHQAGVAVELREVMLRDKPAQMLALSPKATVPVLHCVDGQVIEESLEIMRWALRRRDPGGWLEHADSAPNAALLVRNDGPFKQALDRYKYADRHPAQNRDSYRDQAERALLDELEHRLQAQPFIGGAKACLVDAAIFPFVRQFAAVDPPWFDASRWVHTRRWLQRWLDNPVFAGVMMKTGAWSAGQPPFVVDWLNRSSDRSA